MQWAQFYESSFLMEELGGAPPQGPFYNPQTVCFDTTLLLFFTTCMTKWQIPRQQGRPTTLSSCWAGAFFSFFTHTDSFLPSFPSPSSFPRGCGAAVSHWWKVSCRAVAVQSPVQRRTSKSLRDVQLWSRHRLAATVCSDTTAPRHRRAASCYKR